MSYLLSSDYLVFSRNIYLRNFVLDYSELRLTNDEITVSYHLKCFTLYYDRQYIDFNARSWIIQTQPGIEEGYYG